MVQELKLVVLGTGAVGKSAVTVQFVQGVFITRYDPTIEDCYRKAMEVDGEQVVIDILDTAGTEQFGSMRDLYMKEGDGFVFVYSIVARASFTELLDMKQQLERVRDGAPVPLILLGNKADLADERVVSQESGRERAAQWGAMFSECSAKMTTGVSEAFVMLVRHILAERAAVAAKSGAAGGRAKTQRRLAAACTML